MTNWQPVREELVNYTKDGVPFWLELDITPIVDETGWYTHWVAIERDVTERKRTTAALITSEDRYRQLFRSNPLPLLVYDPDTLQFLDVNDVACARYGYSRQEFLAMNLRDIRPPEDVVALERRLPESGMTTLGSGPWRHLRKDGTVMMVEINNHEVRLNGSSARLVCPIDVTDKVFAQEEIRRMNLLLERKVEERTEELSRSLALQQSLFDNVPQIVWLADLTGAVTFANRIWSEKIGIVPDDWKGDGWSRALHADDLDRVVQAWHAAAPAKHVFEIEFRFLHREEGYHHYQVHARKVLDRNGEPICWVGICSDVSHGRRREEALQFANKELEAFSASVSHDLRAPLRTIAGFSERLELDCGDQLDEQGRHCVARIRAGAANMSELIDDLLSLSKVTRADMAMGSVDLSALARRVFDDLRQGEPFHPAEIVIRENMRVRGDAGLLRILFVNLIGNALKFSGRRDVIRIEVGETPGGGEIATYFVRDNGAGFDPAYAAKIFGVFQRLHSAKEFPGTGIGLATVQRIVHRHGGRVRAEGAVDRGATIYFSLQPE
jgi:PAS domain S-box-containing protein